VVDQANIEIVKINAKKKVQDYFEHYVFSNSIYRDGNLNAFFNYK